MGTDLQEARRFIDADRRLEEFAVRQEGGELHLERSGDRFARLLPVDQERWRLEIFRDAEEWEIVHITGTLEDCLTQLVEHPRLQFWKG
jgi:hypothetical protein